VSEYKRRLVDELFAALGGASARVLDLGCGSCANVVTALERHPNVRYTGVEQDRRSLAQAEAGLAHLGNAEVHWASGERFPGEGYDLVMSLSVLEHVKHLSRFLRASVHAARPGGRLVHRYDLGHALHPATRGERVRVATAKRFPALVPASRFTTAPDLARIVGQLSILGVDGIEVKQGQMPSLKHAMNRLDAATDDGRRLAQRIVDLDETLWERVGTRLAQPQRDRLFPTITVSGTKSTPPAGRG